MGTNGFPVFIVSEEILYGSINASSSTPQIRLDVQSLFLSSPTANVFTRRASLRQHASVFLFNQRNFFSAGDR